MSVVDESRVGTLRHDVDIDRKVLSFIQYGSCLKAGLEL